MLFLQIYTSLQFHIESKCTKLPTYQVRQRPGANFINKVPRTNLKSVVGHFLGYA